jgi:hypothetical protein
MSSQVNSNPRSVQTKSTCIGVNIADSFMSTSSIYLQICLYFTWYFIRLTYKGGPRGRPHQMRYVVGKTKGLCLIICRLYEKTKIREDINFVTWKYDPATLLRATARSQQARKVVPVLRHLS